MKYSRKQIVEAIRYWNKQLDESTSFGTSVSIDDISELILVLRDTLKLNTSKENSYENRAYRGELVSAIEEMQTIEKNLRLLYSKNGDIQAERETITNMFQVLLRVVRSLIFVIRAKYGMSMQGYAARRFNNFQNKFDRFTSDKRNMDSPFNHNFIDTED